MRGIALVGGLVVAWALVLPAGPATAATAPVRPSASIVDLGTLPGAAGSEAVDINDEGIVVGRSAGHAVRWDQSGRITDLGTLPAGHYSHAVAINDRGTVVGQATAFDRYHLVLWDRAGRITDVGTLPGGTWFEPVDIGDDGTVLGYGNDADNTGRPALWHRDTGFRVLPPLVPGAWTTAFAINDRGVAVGISHPPEDFIGHGVRWNADGTVTDLGHPTNMWAVPSDVNNAGVVVGTGVLGADTLVSPIRWSRGGRLSELPTPNDRGHALAVNRSGVAVGVWKSYSAAGGIRWDDAGAMTVLDQLPDHGWGGAMDLNDHGVAIGWATRYVGSTGISRAVRWDLAGRVTDLGTLGGPTSTAHALNGQGTTVGTAETADGRTRAVLWPAPLGG